MKKELVKANKNLTVEIKIIRTKGDKILDIALSKIGDKGLFTKELENKLLNDYEILNFNFLKDLLQSTEFQIKQSSLHSA